MFKKTINQKLKTLNKHLQRYAKRKPQPCNAKCYFDKNNIIILLGSINEQWKRKEIEIPKKDIDKIIKHYRDSNRYDKNKKVKNGKNTRKVRY